MPQPAAPAALGGGLKSAHAWRSAFSDLVAFRCIRNASRLNLTCYAAFVTRQRRLLQYQERTSLYGCRESLVTSVFDSAYLPTTPPALFTALFWSRASRSNCDGHGDRCQTGSPRLFWGRSTYGMNDINICTIITVRCTCRYSVGLARPRGSKPRSPGSDPSNQAGRVVFGSQSPSPAGAGGQRR